MIRHLLCALAFVVRWAIRLLVMAVVLGMIAMIGFVIYDGGVVGILIYISVMSAVIFAFLFLCALYSWATSYSCARPVERTGS